MRYMFLIYSRETEMAGMSAADMDELKAAHWAVMDETRARGIFRGAEPLHPTATATTVRMEGGKPLVLDRRDKGAARRVLHPRLQGPRRGDRVGRQDSDGMQGPRGLRRDPPDHGAALAVSPTDVCACAESVFRHEHGRIIAGLIRLCGSFDRAEEAMQDALAAALVHWPHRGIPQNPAAWIMTAAHRKL